MTERLYFADPDLTEFDAEVTRLLEIDGKPGIVLDRSAFYPEGGGQLADRGTLSSLSVIDVQVDDAGEIHHFVSGELPAIGTRVHGRIDRGRRRVHRALHTGQHMLSRALVDVARAETVSSRLGENACTIDVGLASLDEALVSRAEDLANAIVDDDVAVRAFFPTPDQLRARPLRRAPKVEDSIRVVQIGDFDVTPCGGTHCTRSAQVGSIHVSGIERYKGGTRVTFSAGARARRELFEASGLLRSLGRGFSCGPGDVPAAIEKIRRELQATREELGKTRAKIAEQTAEEMVQNARATGEQTIIAVVDGATPELLRSIGARLTEMPEAIAILAGSSSDGTPVLVARGSLATLDCGSFLKRLAALGGGRGGGRPERAEGRLPAGVDFRALAERALEV